MFNRTITIKISCDESTPIPTNEEEAVGLLADIYGGQIKAKVNICHNDNLNWGAILFTKGGCAYDIR